jgi:hypothetical protein
MDFEKVLDLISGFFDDRERPWAVVGGLAMVAYGFGRTTLDVDILASGSDQDALVGFLETQGYSTIHRSTGFSNHRSDEPERGQVDVIYVRGATEESLFAAISMKSIGPGRVIPVPSPEHLAALKAFAIRNDPMRVAGELEDIRFLLGLHGIDTEAVHDAIRRYGLEELLDRLD